jgi:hypothetical protein
MPSHLLVSLRMVNLLSALLSTGAYDKWWHGLSLSSGFSFVRVFGRLWCDRRVHRSRDY